jgi:hypothetical protein
MPRLGSRLIGTYNSINNFQAVSEWHCREAEGNVLYFVIEDRDQPQCDGSERSGLRYLSQATAYAVQVTFPALDCRRDKLVVNAVQVSALDRSLWMVTLGPTQSPRSGNVRFSITEDGVTRRWTEQQAIVVDTLYPSSC